MPNVTYTILKNRQKLYTKAYAVLCLIILLSMGFYTYQRWQEYSFVQAAVTKNSELSDALKEQVSNEKALYDVKKEGFKNLNREIDDKLGYIFPAEDNYISLTRQFDTFEEELSRKNNPFEVSNIDFQSVVKNDYYSILPIRMNIKSSSENFTKFLHMIETSGSLSDQVRLMDIQSIRLNFSDSGNEDATTEIVNFTVQINAYFQ